MSKFTRFWLIVIFVLSAAVRLVDLGTHFAHYDDITVATDILKTREPYFEEQLLTAIYDQASKSYTYKSKALIRQIYENNPFIFRTGLYLAQFLIVPANSNSAPLQFLLTPFLINKTQTYRTILFFSRLPSCIFSILTIWLMYLVLRGKTNSTGLLSGLLICALSLESIIYAKQTYTYALGCLAAAGLLLLYQHSTAKNFFQKHWIGSGILTSLFVYSHYQLIFFLPAYYLAKLWAQYKNRINLKHLIFSGLVNLMLCLPVLYFLVFLSPSGSSGLASYTLGKYGEFLFSPGGKNLLELFAYIPAFLLKNSFLVLAHTLSPVTADKALFWPLGGIFFLTFLYGLKKIYRQPEGLFVYLSLITYLGLIFTQKIAFTPTRQSLVYLPLLVYPIAYSFSKIKKQQLSFFLITYIGIFLYFFPGFVRERQDILNEAEITSRLEQYNPDLIVGYNYTPHLSLFQNVRSSYNYIDQDNLIPHRPAKKYDTVVFLSTRSELDARQFQKSQRLWNNRQSGSSAWDNTYKQYRIIDQKIITSNIELEPNNWNSNGRNSLFFYVLHL